MGLSIVRSIVIMLGGSIGIRSEVGQGTEVTIRLPLMRPSGTDSAASTPSVAGSTEEPRDDAVTALQAEYPSKTIALYGIANGTKIGDVLKKYITEWFGLGLVSAWSASLSADIILVDEKQFPSLLETLETNFVAAAVTVLCSNSSRYCRKASHMNSTIAVEFVSKPYGPYKLAKALKLCLDKAKNIDSVLRPTVAIPECSMISDAGTIVSSLEALNLEPEDAYAQPSLPMNGTVAAGESVNARMAVNTLSTTPETERPTKGDEEFPFPAQGSETQDVDAHNIHGPDRDNLTKFYTRRPKPIHRATEPPRPTEPFSITVPAFPLLVTNGEGTTVETLDPTHSGITTPRAAFEPQEQRPPRLLLVDDNTINLRLLQTYMRKRKYKLVDSAMNGQLAVEAAEHHPEGYDIIFMGELLNSRDSLQLCFLSMS